MKRSLYILLCASVVFAPLPAAARENDCGRQCFKATLCDIKHELRELNEKQSCTHIITAKDIGTNGYVINDPGYYCLGEDVNFTATAQNGYAIQIFADNVTVDLEGHTLAQVNGTSATFCSGILIGEGLEFSDPTLTQNNITIKNGTIQNFSGFGVQAYNASYDSPYYTPTVYSNLFFSGLNVLGCGVASSPGYDASAPAGGILAGGIVLNSANFDQFADNTNPVAFENVVINDCNVNGCFGNQAILVSPGDSVVIQNTQANDLYCTNEGEAGCFAYSIYGSNIQLFNCQGNRTTSFDQTDEGQVGGISLEASLNIYIKDSQFNAAYGDTDFIVNNNLSLNVNAVYENCQFNNNQGGPKAHVVAGVHGSASPGALPGRAIRWINCQFNGQSVDPTSARSDVLAGFFCTTLRDMDFEDCQACNIEATGQTESVCGFFVAVENSDDASTQNTDERNISFRRCIVSSISGNNQVLGYGLVGENNNVNAGQIVHKNGVFEDCIAQDISSSTTFYSVAGISNSFVVEPSAFFPMPPITQFPQQINLFVRDCRVSAVKSNSTTPSPLSAGILAQAIQNPGLLNNSVSDCDRGILLTGTTAVIPNGFQLAVTVQDTTDVPPVYIPITAPTGSATYSFTNTRLGVTVFISPDQITNSFVLPVASVQDWLPGDPVTYAKSSVIAPNIPGLVNGATYYAVVYIPGFSRNGVVQNNEVDNCTISGYQDDTPNSTTSAWLDNAAVLNGTNYAIVWNPGPAPVDTGHVGGPYPIHGHKYYNVALEA